MYVLAESHMGGWTTSTGMHEANLLPCIFGCTDAKDEFRHYSTCTILWQLAEEALNLREHYFDVGHRLCLTECNSYNLELLGYLLCHSLRKDGECFDNNGEIRSSQIIQQRASDSFRALLPLIE